VFISGLQSDFAPATRLDELGIGELFVVSSMRLWLLSHSDADFDYPDWRQGFQRARIGTEGALGFETLCRLLATSAIEPLVVHRLHCPALATHEWWCLQALYLLQRDCYSGAETLLMHRCRPSVARLALSPATSLARALRMRALWIACRASCEGNPPAASIH
jgi:hypothetical protein